MRRRDASQTFARFSARGGRGRVSTLPATGYRLPAAQGNASRTMAENRTKPASPRARAADGVEPAAEAVVPDQAAERTAAPEFEATPSMAQFLEIKAANPDSLLWYRMGDFYELFFDDAVVASKALGIVLTKRGKHLGQDIPMCGVPIHRADEYLQRLIRQGHR